MKPAAGATIAIPAMQYQIIPPSPLLKDYVKYFWTVEVDRYSIEHYKINTLVDDSSGLIFQQRVHGSAIKKDGILIPNAFLYGQTTKPTSNECLSSFSCIGVLFHPHTTYELFGFNSSHLTDVMLDWSEIGIMQSLTDEILNSENTAQALDILSDFLQRLIRRRRQHEIFSKSVIDFIHHHQGLLRVQDVKSYFNVSERKLERKFLNEVGVSPRHFIQVIRFQKVLERLRAGHGRMIDIAYDLDFSDQAHFNNLIKKFSNCTPKKLKDSIRQNVVNVFLYK